MGQLKSSTLLCVNPAPTSFLPGQGQQTPSICGDFCSLLGGGVSCCTLPLDFLTPKKSSQCQKNSCLELKCAVFLRAEKCHIQSITKRIDGPSAAAAPHPAALRPQAGAHPPECRGGSSLGGLLLLKSPLCCSRQHPASQGHRVRGRTFRRVIFRTLIQEALPSLLQQVVLPLD